MPKKYISSHGQTIGPHVTDFPTCQFFVSSNTIAKNMSMFAYSFIVQIKFQFSLSLLNREKQFPYNSNCKICHCLFQKLNL